MHQAYEIEKEGEQEVCHGLLLYNALIFYGILLYWKSEAYIMARQFCRIDGGDTTKESARQRCSLSNLRIDRRFPMQYILLF